MDSNTVKVQTFPADFEAKKITESNTLKLSNNISVVFDSASLILQQRNILAPDPPLIWRLGRTKVIWKGVHEISRYL